MKTFSLSMIALGCLLASPAIGNECDAPATINVLKERITCRELMTCSFYKLSYQQLLAIPRDELRTHVSKSMPKNEVSERLVELTTTAGFNLRDVILAIQTVPIDFKPSIKRYECRAEIQFRLERLRGILHAVSFMKYFSSQDMAMLWLVNRPYAEALFEGWFKENVPIVSRMVVRYGVVGDVVDIVEVSDLSR